ncbi:hypothetical protein H4I96_00321 [Botrytis cinerea]
MIALIFGVILYLEVLSDPSSWQIYCVLGESQNSHVRCTVAQATTSPLSKPTITGKIFCLPLIAT